MAETTGLKEEGYEDVTDLEQILENEKTQNRG